LPRIAAHELQNTRCGLKNLQFKLELISEAYGAADVENDFRDWCRGLEEGLHPKYPIFDYMKVIDSRLGSSPEEKRADFDDPAISELQSLAYELTGLFPVKTSVANARVIYSVEEIKDALVEYTEALPDKGSKADMRAFWAEGGVDAIILARRRRAEHAR
jgi:hypothetical protein